MKDTSGPSPHTIQLQAPRNGSKWSAAVASYRPYVVCCGTKRVLCSRPPPPPPLPPPFESIKANAKVEKFKASSLIHIFIFFIPIHVHLRHDSSTSDLYSPPPPPPPPTLMTATLEVLTLNAARHRIVNIIFSYRNHVHNTHARTCRSLLLYRCCFCLSLLPLLFLLSNLILIFLL